MAQQQKPIDDLPAYATPVIDMQDLERNPPRRARRPDVGMQAEPRINTDVLGDFVKVDEKMLRALEEVEKEFREEPPAKYAIPFDVSNPFAR